MPVVSQLANTTRISAISNLSTTVGITSVTFLRDAPNIYDCKSKLQPTRCDTNFYMNLSMFFTALKTSENARCFI